MFLPLWQLVFFIASSEMLPSKSPDPSSAAFPLFPTGVLPTPLFWLTLSDSGDSSMNCPNNNATFV